MIELTIGSGDAASFGLLVMLEELGLPYRLHRIDLMALDQWGAAHRALSPGGAVPLLRDGPVLLEAGDLALDYLAERHADQGFAMADPAQHYACQKLICRLDELLGERGNLAGWTAQTEPAVRADYLRRLAVIADRPRLCGWPAVWRDVVPPDERPAVVGARLPEGVAFLAEALGEGDWLVGGRLSVADIAACAHLRGLDVLLPPGKHVGDHGNLVAWRARVEGRAAWSRALRRLEEAGVTMRFSPPVDEG
jgi:glutathione S-transferase